MRERRCKENPQKSNSNSKTEKNSTTSLLHHLSSAPPDPTESASLPPPPNGSKCEAPPPKLYLPQLHNSLSSLLSPFPLHTNHQHNLFFESSSFHLSSLCAVLDHLLPTATPTIPPDASPLSRPTPSRRIWIRCVGGPYPRTRVSHPSPSGHPQPHHKKNNTSPPSPSGHLRTPRLAMSMGNYAAAGEVESRTELLKVCEKKSVRV